MKSPKEVLFIWAKALNNHDAKAASALYHDDAVHVQVPLDMPLRGKDDIHDDFVTFFESNPDVHVKFDNIFEDGEWAMIEWTRTGTFFISGEPVGKKYTLHGSSFFQVLAGKILFQRSYWDSASLMNQMRLPSEEN